MDQMKPKCKKHSQSAQKFAIQATLVVRTAESSAPHSLHTRHAMPLICQGSRRQGGHGLARSKLKGATRVIKHHATWV
jgi:hypothetical protein